MRITVHVELADDGITWWAESDDKITEVEHRPDLGVGVLVAKAMTAIADARGDDPMGGFTGVRRPMASGLPSIGDTP